jgi:hypothetical protein
MDNDKIYMKDRVAKSRTAKCTKDGVIKLRKTKCTKDAVTNRDQNARMRSDEIENDKNVQRME